MASVGAPARGGAYGQSREPTPVDRFGVWLGGRTVRRNVSFSGARFADFGCGFDASFARSQLPAVQSALLVDLALADDLKRHPKVTAIEGDLMTVLPDVLTGSLDVALCLSVLEHLWDPQDALGELRRILAPGGVLAVNVPAWLGKPLLELTAFRLSLSPAEEMDDHKCYYNPRDLWPMLVRAGFSPSMIRCGRHKFGLNTYAICRTPGVMI